MLLSIAWFLVGLVNTLITWAMWLVAQLLTLGLVVLVGYLAFCAVFLAWDSWLRARPHNTESLEPGSIKRVAVIGAGASGLAAAKEALEAGVRTCIPGRSPSSLALLLTH